MSSEPTTTDAPAPDTEQLPALARELGDTAVVECMSCREEWSSGVGFLADGIRTLRAEAEAQRRLRSEGLIYGELYTERDAALRHALEIYARAADTIAKTPGHSVATRCSLCALTEEL